MRGELRRAVLPRRRFLDDALDALGRKALLGKREAAIEHLAVARDLAVAQREVADALERDRLALGARDLGAVAEPIVRVAGAPVADWIEELPAKILARLVEVRDHAGDRGCARIGAVEAVLVDAVGCEQ